MLDNVTLVQLRTFATVARIRNFTHAAEVLGYTPPAVHQQIGKLERALNVMLVKRDHVPMELTREGERLLPAVNRVLDGLGELTVLSRSVRADARVAVAGGRSTGVYVLPALLHRYAQVAPNTQVDYSVASAEELIEGVMTGDLDLAVSSRVVGLLDRHEARRRGLRLTPWKAIRSGLFRLPEWTSNGGPISVFAAPYADVARLERMLAEAFPVLKDRQWRVTALPSTDAVRSALLNGLGMALITEDAVRRELANGTVVRERRTGTFRPDWAHLLHRDTRSLSPEARSLAAFIARQRHDGDCSPQAAPRGLAASKLGATRRR